MAPTMIEETGNASGAARSHHAIALVRSNGPKGVSPILLVDDGSGSPMVLRELLALSTNLLNNGTTLAHVRALNATIGRLADLHGRTWRNTAMGAENLMNLSCYYAHLRFNGVGQDSLLGLDWKPVKWVTLQADLAHIARYSSWCEKYGHLPLLPTRPISPDTEAIAALAGLAEKDFFRHLSARRVHWAQLAGTSAIDTPRRRVPTRRSHEGAGLSEEAVHELIEAERHPVYRALWIMGAWGGVRMSEQLNMWVCDVAPAALRPKLFPGDADETSVLAILADPSESTWCGTLADSRTTRRQFLLKRYGLPPRPDLFRSRISNNGQMGRAGFKGMWLSQQDRLISQVYWLNPEMAAEYERAIAELLDERRGIGAIARHPYLFVATDRRRPENLGNPLEMSSIDRAWERACRRIGQDPYKNSFSKHQLRHFYKSYAEYSCGLSRGDIKILLHHKSEQSQDEYGNLRNDKFRDSLNAGMKRAITYG